MGRGKYIRTSEIRRKHSERIKLLHETGEYNNAQKLTSFKDTIEKKKLKGEKVGRKSKIEGGKYHKKGIDKPCPVCSKPVYYTPKEINENKRKCCSKNCLYKDCVYREKLRGMDKTYMQTEEYRLKKTNPNTPEYLRYARKVRKFTELNYVKYREKINPNNYPRTLCGVEGGYQLDHIKSIKECWNSNIPPEVAALPDNLKMVTWQENLYKRKFDPILKHGNKLQSN